MIEERNLDTEIHLSRAKVYGFLSSVFLYPTENWTEDFEYVLRAVHDLGYPNLTLGNTPVDLQHLQSEFLRTIGVSGPLPYETEYGLASSFRQSQELADLSGFYRAFGFAIGGQVRERPDHLAAELEFMHLLALKEWHSPDPERARICREAQGKFLQDHLGRWIEAFAIRLAFEARDSLYAGLARFAAGFVQADAAWLGVQLEPLVPERLKPTPFEASNECGDCPIADELA